MNSPVFLLALKLAFLAAISVGGFFTTVPELHRYIVEAESWMTEERFTVIFSLSQTVPGPNIILATLLGWEIGGVSGAVIATLAACLPMLVIAYVAFQKWQRHADAKWYRVIEASLMPVVVGLITSTGIIIARAAVSVDITRILVVVGTVTFLLLTKRSPLIPLGTAALLGAAGFV